MLPLHLLIENAVTTPHCTQKQSCFLDTNVQKPWSFPLLRAGEALGMKEATLAPQQTPGSTQKSRNISGIVFLSRSWVSRCVTPASGGSTGTGLKGEFMGEGNTCSLPAALGRLPTTSLLCELFQPAFFLIF